MTRVDDVARTLNTVGLAAWFGGSLMGAAALRGTDRQALEAEHDAWKRWSPVQTAAIAAHLVGSTKLATTNKGRLLAQRGVGKVSVVKTACTAGALAATFYASRLGREVHHDLDEAPAGDGAGGPQDGGLPAEVQDKLRRLRLVQLAVPALTGAMLVADSRLGEQQRPMEVLRGVAARAVPDALQSLPDTLQHLPETLQHLPAAVPQVRPAVEDLAHQLPEAVRHLVTR